VCAELQQIAKY